MPTRLHQYQDGSDRQLRVVILTETLPMNGGVTPRPSITFFFSKEIIM
jgi:hypothetical protein